MRLEGQLVEIRGGVGAPPDSLQMATQLTARGWRVVPIPRGEKNPGYQGWQQTDLQPGELASRFGRGENIGVLLGEPSGGLVDVDLDCPEAAAVAAHLLPATHMLHGRPSRLRSHWWYLAENAASTAQFRDPVSNAMLVELRSTGGQTVVPPSVHPEGEVLSWAEWGEPSRVAWNDLLQCVQRIAAVALIARHWPKQGARDTCAMAIAGYLLRGGLSTEEVERFLRLVVEAAGDEEAASRVRAARDTARKLAADRETTGGRTLRTILETKVVDRLAVWLGLRDATEPATPSAWDVPAPLGERKLPTFPTTVLPSWLRDWVEAEAEATQTPPDLAAMVALSVCALSLAQKFVVEVRPGYREPLNIFTVTVLPPGNRKSAVFAHAMEPVTRHEVHEAQRLAPEIEQAASEYRIAADRLKRAEHEAGKADPSKRAAAERKAKEATRQLAAIKVPAPPRLVTDDCSVERLTSLLHEQGGRMAVMSAEGDIFDLIAGRYSGNGRPNFGVFLHGHAGDAIHVDRIGRPSEVVRHPALTVGLTVQPSVIEGLAATPQFRGRGLLGRFLYAIPVSPLGRRITNAPPVPIDISSRYEAHISTLLSLDVPRDEDGEADPVVIRFEPDALGACDEFAEWLEPQLGETAALGWMADWAGKLTGAVVRLAGLLHVAAEVSEGRKGDHAISCRTLASAVAIGTYLLEHAKAAFADMGADPDLHNAKHVLKWIANSGLTELTRRDLFEGTKGRFRRVTDLDPAVSLLCEHGYLRRAPEPEKTGPGRKPSPTYEVNPSVFEPEETSSGAEFAEGGAV